MPTGGRNNNVGAIVKQVFADFCTKSLVLQSDLKHCAYKHVSPPKRWKAKRIEALERFFNPKTYLYLVAQFAKMSAY